MSEQTEQVEKVNKIIAEAMCVNTDQIGPKDNFEEDLYMDSLDKVEVLMAIEEEFNIEINDKLAIETMTTFDLYEVVQDLTL
jgi:acyl carrier protein